jgi:ACT domain-containing protein
MMKSSRQYLIAVSEILPTALVKVLRVKQLKMRIKKKLGCTYAQGTQLVERDM